MMFLLSIIFGVFGRLMVHIPNVTPMTSLCLLAPAVFSKRDSFLVITITLLLSDLLLHFLLHYPVLGSWTLFTYSASFLIVAVGFILKNQFTASRAMWLTAYSAVFFWVWTNFGTWCTSMMYAHTAAGLMQCFIAGLPFLRNGLAGSLVWTCVLLLLGHYIIHRNIPAFRRNRASFLKLVRKPN